MRRGTESNVLPKACTKEDIAQWCEGRSVAEVQNEIGKLEVRAEHYRGLHKHVEVISCNERADMLRDYLKEIF